MYLDVPMDFVVKVYTANTHWSGFRYTSMTGPNGLSNYALWVFMPSGYNRVMKIRRWQKYLLWQGFQIKKFLFLKTVLNYGTITGISSLFGWTPPYVRPETDFIPWIQQLENQQFIAVIFRCCRAIWFSCTSGSTTWVDSLFPFSASYAGNGKSG